MKTNIVLILSSIVMCVSLQAQVIPINHEMKNLKTGNIFFYHFQAFDLKTSKEINQFYYDKVIRYDTTANKVYAVFQNGVRERADSSGVYWLPLSFDSTKPFTKEFLRYPLFPVPNGQFNILDCGGANFMVSRCFPEDHPIYKPVNARVTLSSDTNFFVLGIKIRSFSLTSVGLGRVDYATLVGPWRSVYFPSNESYTTTLCGALIEGKYYGDSACLVASSTPLQRAEFAALAPSLAPNPVSDIATLRFILPTAQGVTIEIYDMLGREVAPPLRFEALSSGMNALPIEMASLPRGVYAVRLRTALGLRATTMMVKE